ncbi:MAG: recombination mediator RecR [Thermanaerothrix sp.]|nr:recombination mediator RecR [Thermanaerothrix sp.]
MSSTGVLLVDRLIEKFKRLPGVGEKGARRFAFFVLQQSPGWVEEFARDLLEARSSIRQCRVCGGLAEKDLCPVCLDPNRSNGVICVVETVEDSLVIERHGVFDGRYHVLGGRFSPMDGEEIPRERLDQLRRRVAQEGIAEVILALNPSVEGELTAMAVRDAIGDLPVRVTRLAFGIPVGGSIGFVDSATLKLAMEGRRGL